MADVLDLDIPVEFLDGARVDDMLKALMIHLARVTVWCDIDYDSEHEVFHVHGVVRNGKTFDSRVLGGVMGHG